MMSTNKNIAAMVLANNPVTAPIGIDNLVLALDGKMSTLTRITSGVLMALKITAVVLTIVFRIEEIKWYEAKTKIYLHPDDGTLYKEHPLYTDGIFDAWFLRTYNETPDQFITRLNGKSSQAREDALFEIANKFTDYKNERSGFFHVAFFSSLCSIVLLFLVGMIFGLTSKRIS